MGIMDMVDQATGGSGDHAQAAGGLMQELESHPGGITGVFSAFQNNGLGGLVQKWAGGNTAPASQQEVEQGLGNTGLIDTVANRVGMSPTAVKAGMAVVLPLLIHHYVSNGHVTAEGQPTGAPMPPSAGVLQSVLGRIL